MPGLSLLRGVYLNPKTDPNDLKRYHAIETRDISYCPMATRTSGVPGLKSMSVSTGQVSLEMSPGGTFLAWEILTPAPAFRGSYGVNRNLFAPSMFAGSDILAGGSKRELNVYALKQCGAIPALLDGAGPNCWMVKADEPPPKWEPSDAHPSSASLIDQHLPVHQPAQRDPEYPVPGLVGPTRGAQGAVDAEVAWQIRYRRTLDQGRRRPTGRLAPMDAEIQRLLRCRVGCAHHAFGKMVCTAHPTSSKGAEYEKADESDSAGVVHSDDGPGDGGFAGVGPVRRRQRHGRRSLSHCHGRAVERHRAPPGGLPPSTSGSPRTST